MIRKSVREVDLISSEAEREAPTTCDFPDSTLLDDCDKLKAVAHCDKVHYLQFFTLQWEDLPSKETDEDDGGDGKPEPDKSPIPGIVGSGGYLTHGGRLLRQLERLQRKQPSSRLHLLQKMATLLQERGRLDVFVPALYQRARLAPYLEAAQKASEIGEGEASPRPQAASISTPSPSLDILRAAIGACPEPAPPLRRKPGPKSIPRNPMELFTDLLNELGIVPTPPDREPPLEPLVALGVTFVQEWCSNGYRRGRLVRSIPLTPGETVEIVTRTWKKHTDRRVEVKAVEQDISTEVVGDEKWSLATTKQVSGTLSGTGTVTTKLTKGANISLPTKAGKIGASGGAELGTDSTTSATISGGITQTEEEVKQTTYTSANHLKNSVTSTVEMASETGREVTRTQSISNPNRCHTVTYHFFEIVEDFTVTTRAEVIEPYLLIPLAYPHIDKKWILCHECLLRPLMPCETYYAGFDAAKELLANEHLGLFQGSLNDDVVNNAAAAMETVVQQVLAIYRKLSQANIGWSGDLPTGPGSDFGACIAEITSLMAAGRRSDAELKAMECGGKAWEFFRNTFGQDGLPGGEVAETVTTCMEEMLDLAANQNWPAAGSKALECGGEVLAAFCRLAPWPFNNICPQPAGGQSGFSLIPSFQMQMVPTGTVLAADMLEVGPGSYFYWQLLQLLAPELELALATLAARYDQVRELSEGAQRNRALVEAVATFVNQIGDMQAAFGRIDLVTFTLSSGGIAAVSGLAGAAGGPGLMISAAILGSLMTLVAGFVDEAGLLDIMPDDEGLEQAMMSLYGHYLSMAQFVGEVAVLGANATLEERAQYEQMLLQRRQEQRHYAKLRVEYERLACHLRENIAFYAQAVWSSVNSADIQRLLQHFNIPPHAVEPVFAGFVGNRAALRVTDPVAIFGDDLDWTVLREELGLDELLEAERSPLCLTMPTPGMTVEPALGECDACEEFVRRHRRLDLKERRAEVKTAAARAKQEKIESVRLAKRLSAGLLGDPTPYEGANTISVQVDAAEDDNE